MYFEAFNIYLVDIIVLNYGVNSMYFGVWDRTCCTLYKLCHEPHPIFRYYHIGLNSGVNSSYFGVWDRTCCTLYELCHEPHVLIAASSQSSLKIRKK